MTSRSLKAYRKLTPQGLLECVISIIGTVFKGYLWCLNSVRRERFILLHNNMWKILHHHTSNDINVQFVSRPRFGNLAVIPSACRHSSAANQSLYDNSFAVIGPKLWNAMPYHLNCIGDREHFKSQLIQFMLSVFFTAISQLFKSNSAIYKL